MRELAKTYNASDFEDKIYENWEKKGFFNPDGLNKATKAYAIVMPPPNVTGTLHLGHATMLALEDILVRFYRMAGRCSLWLPGTDHAAIATQAKVEKILKEEGTDRHNLGREKFLERVKSFAQDSHDTIVNQTKKMGSSCDWSREAYTLDETRSKAVRSVFKMMYDDGLIYRGERVVNWCPKCHSTLSDDEVEYKGQKAKLYFFKYDKDFPITIATTRPETKLGDTAIAVNPKDERYKQFIGNEYKADFCGIELHIKIIADRHIDMDFGSGALGVTPAHSQADSQMAEENDLEAIKVIDEDGKIREGFGGFSGLDVYAARKKILAELNDLKLIEKEEEIDNNLSICYRCDAPIEPLPSLQWFVDVNKKIARRGNKTIKELSVAAVREGVFGRDKINILPERFEKNYYHWMENLRDWCISRQIVFGHQVPVWYKDSEIYVGVEAPAEEGWIQDKDTLDTWFSSGIWTFSTLADSPEQILIKNGELRIDSDDFHDFHPTQVLETGYDILFFWVARMIIMTTYAIGDIPFENVYLHGLILDDKGKKMSKSKGNVIDPLTMIAKYGTDAVRLALIIGSSPGNDIKMSEEKIAGFRNLINKIWNISRFIMQNIKSGEEKFELKLEKLSLSERWIIEELNKLIISNKSNLENYRFSQAGEDLRTFTKDYLADWYLEASKFEQSENKELLLKKILETILKLWHPFIPFVTEVVWQNFKDSDLIIEAYPKMEEDFKNVKDDGFKLVQDIIIAIRNARSENKIEPAKKVKTLIRAGKNESLLKSQSELIKRMRTGVSDIIFVEELAEDDEAIKVIVAEIEIHLLGGIDKEKESKRIAKEIENLRKLIDNCKKKLSNKDFAEKAPKGVVERERKNLRNLEDKLASLQ